MTDKVIHVDFQSCREAENEMVAAMKDLIYSFAGRMSTASAFGVIEIVKYDLTQELLK